MLDAGNGTGSDDVVGYLISSALLETGENDGYAPELKDDACGGAAVCDEEAMGAPPDGY